MYKIHEISIYKYYRRLVILSIGAQTPDIYPYTYLFLYIQNYKWHVNTIKFIQPCVLQYSIPQIIVNFENI
jgi:hypothetical protein